MSALTPLGLLSHKDRRPFFDLAHHTWLQAMFPDVSDTAMALARSFAKEIEEFDHFNDVFISSPPPNGLSSGSRIAVKARSDDLISGVGINLEVYIRDDAIALASWNSKYGVEPAVQLLHYDDPDMINRLKEFIVAEYTGKPIRRDCNPKW